MKRTLEQTLAALENQIRAWASAPGSPEIRVLAYPPEREAVMLARIEDLVRRLEQEGHRVEVVDVGQGFLAALDRRAPLVERLMASEGKEERQVVHDLGVLASRYLGELFRRPLGPGAVCRLVVNTGSLAAVTSYSAVMNGLHGAKGDGGPGAPTLVAFPGEADDRSLNLLGLRRETNYRTARI
jgi:hypothetical protein